MERLGPWDGARRVAVAVSGGADSLALAVLAQRWGDPAVFICDHGLRAESAAEAEATRAALAARGMPATVLRLGVQPGSGLAARARIARYAALGAACREAGLVDLLLGHHAGDQAETVLMRQRRGSGDVGLAGMAAVVERDDVRLLRPLLAFDPAVLRAMAVEAGLVPVEDPTNTDPRATRARLRQEIGENRAGLLADAARHGADRTLAEVAVAQELAARVMLYPGGYAVLSPGPVGVAALGAVLRSLSGRRYPVDAASLAAVPKAATLGGVRVQPAGRAGDGWLLTREVSAAELDRPATSGTVWDGRFRIVSCPTQSDIGALRHLLPLPSLTGEGGGDGDPRTGIGSVRIDPASTASCARHPSPRSPPSRGGGEERHLPAAVRQVLPAFRCNGVLVSVPHLRYGDPLFVVRHACLPACGAPFVAA